MSEKVRKNPFVIKEMDNLSEDLCVIAITSNPLVIQYVPTDLINYEMCVLAAVGNCTFRFIPKEKLNYKFYMFRVKT